ncbi:MAG: SdpI family protein, partial [bacterium]|nr:SdpI family protein [bacterium]
MKENVQKFKKHFDRFILLTILCLFYIHALTVLWSYGARFDMARLMAPAIGILFFYAGVLIEKSKRNWFVGIRTPWTLSSDKVWDKTHKLGGKLFKISGIIAMLGFIFPGLAFYLMIFPAILFSIWTVAFSYFEYKKELEGRTLQ